jgi:hypothetical protein
MKKNSAIVLLLITLVTTLSASAQNRITRRSVSPHKQTRSAYKGAELTYKIIVADNNTFGYDIYADGQLRIHQPNIPGLPGNSGFTTKARAEEVAKLVISKVKSGEGTPTIRREELEKLKAI